MKLRKYLVAFSCGLASCSGVDELKETVSDEEIRNAVVCIAPYMFDDGVTRTDLTFKDNKITFNWDDDETIGVFPIAPYSGSQAYKHLERSKDDGHVATFDGGGWKIRPEATYAAYYPYNGKLTNETTFDKIPVSLKRQVQDGYNNLDHIGEKYDYMCATATAPSEGDIVFNFKHITSIVQLEVILPEPGVIANVIIFDKQHEQVFVDSALMNVQTCEVSPVHKTSMVELEVKNGVKAKANEKVLFYVAMLPRDSRPVDITIETKDGKCYETSYTPKDMKAGFAYRWNISPEYAGEHVAVDLGLPSGTKWATMNIGSKSFDGSGTSYFSWGETLPKTDFLMSNYKYGTLKKYTNSLNADEAIMLNLTKYTCDDKLYSSIWYSGNEFIGDGITTLLPEDDAATQNWGTKWRMPTKEEIQELIDNCEWIHTKRYNGIMVTGYILKGKNGNSVFLPLAGYYSSVLDDYGFPEGFGDTYMEYWTSSLKSTNSNIAFVYGTGGHTFSSSTAEFEIIDTSHRCNGAPIRAVQR